VTWGILLLGLAVSAAADEAVVTRLDGSTARGQLVGVAADGATLKAGDQQLQIPAPELLSIRFPSRQADPAPPLAAVALTDGSRLHPKEITVGKQTASIETAAGGKIELRRDAVHWARIPTAADAGLSQRQRAALTPQWEQILAKATTGDVLVIRQFRKDGDKTKVALDFLEGVIRGITPTAVEFEFDDEVIPVPRRKVEGVVFFQTGGGRSLPKTLCRVIDTQGQSIAAASLKLGEKDLSITTPAGAVISAPRAGLLRLDFSAGKLAFLSDLEPASQQYTPYVSAAGTDDLLARLNQIRRDENFRGEPLKLRVEPDRSRGGVAEYRKGVALKSRTLVEYRLPERFSKFEALAGIEASSSGGGHVKLIISGDGRKLAEYAISGGSKPQPVSVDLSGVRRLTILVDFGEDLSILDELALCNARLIK